MDRVLTFEAEGDCVVRDFLRARFSGRRIHFLREKGNILVNGAPATAADRMKKGDLVTLVFVENQTFPYPPEDLGVRIVYEDEDVLVCLKPAGVPSMPAAPHFNGNLFNALAFLRPGAVFRVVTRLDKDTVGLVLVAKNALAHSLLGAKQAQIEKTYTAVALGIVPAPLEIDAPILSDGGRARRVSEGGKPSKTRIIASKPFGGCSLVTVLPLTGRTHQIRVHLAHIGHPVAGDALYGGTPAPAPFGPQTGIKGQLLCCSRLTFRHPLTGETVDIEADPCAELGFNFQISQ